MIAFSMLTLLVVALAPAALANIFITSPAEGAAIQGGTDFTINWQESGTAPLLSDFGPTSVSLCTGSAMVQVTLASLVDSLDPASRSDVEVSVPVSAGPDSGLYFIKFESLAATDEQTGFPLQAFSPRFANKLSRALVHFIIVIRHLKLDSHAGQKLVYSVDIDVHSYEYEDPGDGNKHSCDGHQHRYLNQHECC